MIKEQLLYGVHALAEALHNGNPIDTIYLKKGLISPEVQSIKQMARTAGVPVKEVPIEKLNRLTVRTYSFRSFFSCNDFFHDNELVIGLLSIQY